MPIKQAFAKAGHPPLNSPTELLTVVRNECSRLSTQTAYHAGNNCGSHTIIFPDEVAKGPLEEGHIPLLEQECQVLQHLDDPYFPKVTHIGEKASFFVMTRLPGVMLHEQVRNNMTEDQQEIFAKDIVGCTHRIAGGFTPEESERIVRHGRGPSFKSSDIEELLANPRVRDYLGEDLPRVASLARQYPGRTGSSTESVVFHADLNPGNILVDPASKKLTAVIDFGGVRCGPPEEGLAVLHRFFAPALMDKIYREYEAPGGRAINRSDVALCDMVQDLRYLGLSIESGNDEQSRWIRNNIIRCANECASLSPAVSSERKGSPRPPAAKDHQG
jgi:serine/threonine protein kinase